MFTLLEEKYFFGKSFLLEHEITGNCALQPKFLFLLDDGIFFCFLLKSAHKRFPPKTRLHCFQWITTIANSIFPIYDDEIKNFRVTCMLHYLCPRSALIMEQSRFH